MPKKPIKRPNIEEISDKEVKCGLCKEYLKEPKLLSCLHCICKECIKKKATEWIQQSRIRCPTCGVETEIPNNDLVILPTLNFVENLYSITHKAKKSAILCDKCANNPAMATKFCRQCGFICQQCEGVHEAVKGYEDHEIVAIDRVREDVRRYGKVTTSPQKCSTHARKLKYYCSTCQHLVCRDCVAIGEHKNHKYENVSESKKTRFETLESSLKVLEGTCQGRITEGIESVKDVKSDIDQQVSKISMEINKAIVEAHRKLDERKDELLAQVKAKATEKHNALDKQLKNLRNMNSEIDCVYRVVDSCLHSENVADIAAAHKFMRDKLQQLIHECEIIEVTPVSVANFKTKLRLPEAIQNSMMIEESSADPTKCSVSNGKAEVGEKTTFYIKTVYENNQPCIEAQEVSAEIHPPGDKSSENTIKATIMSCTERRGVYCCTFIPRVRGWHTLSVTVNKQPIRNMCKSLCVHIPPSKLNDRVHSIELKMPYQVAFMPTTGQMIVSQSGNTTVCKITLIGGDSQTEFRKEDLHKNDLPTGIAVAKDGSVYIAYDKPCIVKYDQQGHKVTETDANFKLKGIQLKRPGRIELSRDDRQLFVCDRGNERVVVLDSSLNAVEVFAEKGLYSGIAFGEDNHVYLSDKSKNIICIYMHAGVQLTQFGNLVLKAPRGLLIHNGHLYVSDRNNYRIVVFDISTVDHKLVATFGTKETIYDCGSLTADSNGYIYVCDERGDRIHVF